MALQDTSEFGNLPTAPRPDYLISVIKLGHGLEVHRHLVVFGHNGTETLVFQKFVFSHNMLSASLQSACVSGY